MKLTAAGITAVAWLVGRAWAAAPPAVDPARLSAHIRALSSDAFEGRGPATPGEAAHRDYVTHRYHQPADEWRADWNLRGAAQDLDLYFAPGQYLANSHAWPGWPSGPEFKAVRDQTAAERTP